MRHETLAVCRVVAVAAFLDEGLPYLQIAQVVEKTLNAIPVASADSLDVILEIDARARKFTKELICKR